MQFINIIYVYPGLKGQSNRRLISMDEVRKHKTEGEMWTVLKGRVYNISPYMKFHPGGTTISSIFKFIYDIVLFLLLVSLKLYMHFLLGKNQVLICWWRQWEKIAHLYSVSFLLFRTVLFKFVSLLHLFVSIKLMLPLNI